MKVPKAQYDKLSAEQKRRLENIVSIIKYATENPEQVMKKVTLSRLLKLMESIDDDVAVVAAIEESEDFDNAVDNAAKDLLHELTKMGW